MLGARLQLTGSFSEAHDFQKLASELSVRPQARTVAFELITPGGAASSTEAPPTRAEPYSWTDREKQVLIGMARNTPDPLPNPASPHSLVQSRYDAMVSALWAVKNNKAVNAPDLVPPTADEKTKLKIAIYNWWRNAAYNGGVMFRDASAKWDKYGHRRSDEDRKRMEAASRGGGKRKRALNEPAGGGEGARTGGDGPPPAARA